MGDGDFSVRFSKVVAIARSESLALRRILVDRIKAAWLEAYAIGQDDLNSEERLGLDIVFRVVVDVLGDRGSVVTIADIRSMLGRDLGKGMMRTVVGVLDAHA